MSPYFDHEKVLDLQAEIRQWIINAGWFSVNTLTFVIDHGIEEISELHESTIAANGNLRDPRVLEEFADFPIYILQVLRPESTSLVIHYVNKMMASNRKMDTQLIASYGRDLEKKRSDTAMARTLASIFSFALQNNLDPLELIEIKHWYNLFRYPPFEIRNSYDKQETRKRQKRQEREEDWKGTILSPRLQAVTGQTVYQH